MKLLSPYMRAPLFNNLRKREREGRKGLAVLISEQKNEGAARSSSNIEGVMKRQAETIK